VLSLKDTTSTLSSWHQLVIGDIMVSLAVVLIMLCCSNAARVKDNDIELAHEGRDLKDKFKCKPGQGEAFAAYNETGEKTFESCAALCDVDDECVGFDFTERNSSHWEILSLKPTLAKKDSCRLYKDNAVRWEHGIFGGVADVGNEIRKYCSKLAFAIPTLAEKFSCEPGQGEVAGSYKETANNTFESCATLCDDDTSCVAFDFTTNSSWHPELFSLHPKLHKEDSCRLFPEGKSTPRLSNTSARSYCVKFVQE